MKKFLFLAGLTIGFVLGSRTGRGPYESLERTARDFAGDPEVQRRAAQARETAEKVTADAVETVKQKAPEVASAVTDAASDLKDKVSSAGDDSADLEHASEGTATSGGDAEVGEDKPLGS